jgi:hypothetical protein
MSDDVSAVRKVTGVEEHAWTAELRDALVKFGGDDTVTMMSVQAGIDRRLLDVSDGRLGSRCTSTPRCRPGRSATSATADSVNSRT